MEAASVQCPTTLAFPHDVGRMTKAVRIVVRHGLLTGPPELEVSWLIESIQLWSLSVNA